VRVVKLLSVGLTGTTDEIRDQLQLDCKTVIQDGFRIAIDEISKGHYTFIGCNVIEGELSFRNYERIRNSVKHHVANMLTEFIVMREEKKMIAKIIEQHYHYYMEDERRIIYNRTLKLLDDDDELTDDFCMSKRYAIISEKILQYFTAHHEVVLEGFINFRLKEYKEKLVRIVDKIVDEYVMELEYKEFIRVLRCFVDIQGPEVEEVHIIIIKNGVYKIVDEQGQSINNQNFEKFILQRDDHINYEDLLITALISIAPYSVVIHAHESNDAGTASLVETIRNIFDGRVIVCEGCDFCY